MRLALGIDTGGTYTDAALLDLESGRVVRKAKALTTPADLSEGIANALTGLGDLSGGRIAFTAVSTTLATNAVVEGRGGRTGLIAVGYDRDLLLETFAGGGVRSLPVDEVRFVDGGHDISGNERRPLDRGAALRAIRETAGRVDAYAVSAHGGVRNPAHEAAVRDLIRTESSLPVVCGHELTSELDAIRRAITSVFNARLLPLIRDLIRAVERVLADRDLRAPLMIVKGDGHMMGVEAARQRPIETLLSGPAASFVGGRYLSGAKDVLVVDMGGTTTDVALLRDGVPVLRSDGAAVGGWRTQVRAADVATVGVGGDSHVWFREGEIAVGPRRAIPLCLAAAQHPQVAEELRRLARLERKTRLVAPCDFLVRVRDIAAADERERALLRCLSDGPRSLVQLAGDLEVAHPALVDGGRLERMGAVVRAGLTPTDLLHAEGLYVAWDAEAARAGVAAMARQAGMAERVLIATVRAEVDRLLAGVMLGKLASGWASPPEGALGWLVERASEDGRSSSDLRVHLSATLPVVGIGAPAGAYLPRAARVLGAKAIIPEHAEVANAVGAAVGGVAESVEVVVKAVHSAAGIVGYTVHSAAGMSTFEGREEAVAHAMETARRLAAQRAGEAGAVEADVEVKRADLTGTADPAYGSQIFLETRVRATAVGRGDRRIAPIPPPAPGCRGGA